MDFLVGCASSIAAKFVDSTIGVVARRLFPYRRDVANLTAGIRDLSKARETVEEEVKKARDKGLVIHDDVEEWLSSAGVISERAQAFRRSSRDRANISCCTLRIPNLASRRGLSREARQLLEELERKIEAGRFDSVASRPAMHKGIEIRGDYEHFESRKAILEDIMTALRDRDVTKVGVHGMAGIGKTKLAEEVARRATEANLFTEVVETTVSQKPDIRRLQQDIAGKMKIEFKESEGERERADKLLRRLKEEKKKILIILDDIWERLDLLNVGIHFEHEGCKILMTSRYLAALHSMRADRTFKVEDISAEEAMRLFKTIVGGDIIEQPGIATLVNDVVSECRCLPLAITTVAYALRCQKDPSVWSNALMQLRISAPTDIDGMLVDVYQSIKLSYDFLNSTEAKSLFLLCSLQGEDKDISVEDLMMISVGQGLFQNVHKLSDARNRVKSLVGKLKDHCLLLDGNDSGTVKMHDVIRDVALYIASESGQDMHCIYTDKVEECLNNRKLRNAKVVSLVRYKFETHQLPEGLGCSHLESLFLVSSYFFWGHLAIPKHFLEGKDQLKSLLFNRANLVALSPPIHSLQNLQTLCLHGCVLEDVSFIGDLKSLIILDLSYSTIKQLPIEVGQLNRLQLLNLEGCKALELIEPNVISSLKGLEELHIPYRFHIWEVGEITELMDLRQLTSLTLGVPHSKTFPKHFMFRKELEQYRISIGGSMPFDRRIARSLQLKLEERSQLKELGLESLVKRSEALSLDGLAGVKNVVCDLDNEGFSDLKRLDFSCNVSVQYIVNCTADQQIHLRKAFPMLETLRLEELTNLERICQGKLPQDSFNKLREVDVRNCDKLKNLFPLSIAKRLEKIEVRNCDMMEEVVGHGTENDAHVISDEATHHVVEFLELHSLILQSLPKFVQFINWSESDATCGSPSVQSSIPLFCEKLEFPSLVDLTLSGINVEILWLDFQLRTTPFMDNLTSLDVSACSNLKYLFPFFIAERLVKLEMLIVSDCEVMEDIVVMKNLEEEGRLGKILFPKLRDLTLENLPALRNFCVGDCIKFESLSRLTIRQCPQLKTFFICSTPILEVSVDNEEEGSLGKILFPKLEDLRLENLPALRNFCVGACIKFESLPTLAIKHCPQLKTFFSCSTPILEVSVDNEEGNHSAITQPLFNEKVILPVLKYLETDWSKAMNEQLNMSQSSSTTLVLLLSNQLKELKLNCSTRDKPIALPIFDLLRRYQNLEKLTLKGFFVISAQEYDGQPVANLTMLKLDNVPKLRYLFGESENAQPTNLFACFQNLTILEVSFCHRPTYLLASTIATSLVQLEEMRITACNRMTTIIEDRENETTKREHDHEFVFLKLKILELRNLPHLESFYSGNTDIRLPKLESLFVHRCHEMRTFSSGNISTPMLHEIIYEWRSQSLDGDVNTTVRKLWEDDSNLTLQQLFTETRRYLFPGWRL